jgi:hypothetical protein
VCYRLTKPTRPRNARIFICKKEVICTCHIRNCCLQQPKDPLKTHISYVTCNETSSYHNLDNMQNLIIHTECVLFA